MLSSASSFVNRAFAAATVDWRPLASAVSKGSGGATILAVALAAFLLAAVAGAAISWRRWSLAFAERA